MSERVFRKVSLDRLSSPEQLDQVMQVTRPGGWVALAAAAMLLLAAAAWGVAGTLTDRVTGQGILIKSGGVLEVVATAGGRVTDVSISAGDTVAEGQVIAWLAQPALLDRLQQARAVHEAARREHDQLVRFTARDGVLQRETQRQQRTSLTQSVAAAQESLDALRERLVAQEELVRQGLITRPTLLSTRQQYDGVREKVRMAQADLAQLDARVLAVANQHGETVQASGRRLAESETAVAQLAREFERASQITSPYTGRVLEVMTEQGKLVAAGEPVISLDRTGQAVKELMAVVYVPSVHGKMVRPGMEIQIAPSTVRQEEYGMMLGRVTFVSNFPATPRGMMRVLKNDQLVTQLSGNGAPYEVHAELVVDGSTASRYRWSSSGGPPTLIQSGTLAAGLVTVSAQRPIAKVVPLLRRWTGT